MPNNGNGHRASEASPLLNSAGDNNNNNSGDGTVEIDIEDQSESDLNKIDQHDISCDEHDDHGSNGNVVITESYKSWLRLLLFFVAAVVSGGIMPGQNVYSRLFCEAGLFAYACSSGDDGSISINDGIDADDAHDMNSENDIDSDDMICCPAQWLLLANVMSALSAFMAFFFMAGGLMFDMMGGRLAGVIGCLVNAGGFALLAILMGLLNTGTASTTTSTISISPVVETTMFVVGVLLVDIGSMMTNISFWGFLWHLPKQQALILALSNSVLNVAAFVPVILQVILLNARSSNLSSVLGLYATIIIFVATPMCWLTVPSTQEYRSRAMEVLSLPIPARSVNGMTGAIDMIEKAWRILQHHSQLHFHTIIVVTLAWMSPFIYMTMSNPMGKEIFGDTTSGERLGTMYNICNGYLGLLVGPLLGIVVDRFHKPQDGVQMLGCIIVVTFVLIAAMCPIPSWNVQLVNICASSICQIATMLFMVRYAIIFAPADRVGSVTGLFIAGLGLFSFIPIIATSIDIVIHGSYIQPERWICIIGVLAWIIYAVYIKKTNPWPSSPVLLPEDELKLAKMYGVGTLEDAAYVSGRSMKAFRRMSSSSNVLDQRALLDSAFTSGAVKRMMEVAIRRSSTLSVQSAADNADFDIATTLRRRSSIGLPSINDEDIPPPQYPIVEDTNGNNSSSPAKGTIRRGTVATSLECIVIAFNGHGAHGGRGEPSLQWIMEPMGKPDNSQRVAVVRSLFSPMITCAELVSTILEMRVMDNDGGNNEVTAAACTVFHPGSLENDGSIMETGSDRYYASLAVSGEDPKYMDRGICGEQMMQRWVALAQDSAWDKRRKDYASNRPIWYIQSLGTHPAFQGRGFARRILNVVAKWAAKDGADCYLECNEENVSFYENCGYKTVWRSDIVVDGTGTSLFGMAYTILNNNNSNKNSYPLS